MKNNFIKVFTISHFHPTIIIFLNMDEIVLVLSLKSTYLIKNNALLKYDIFYEMERVSFLLSN